MPEYYDDIDLLWTDDGDFALGRDGDLADTRFDALLAVIQDIYDRIKSDKRDYSENSRIGATLSDFVGEPNTAEAGTQIKKRILTALGMGEAINTSDISLDVFPVSKDQIGIRLSLRVRPTSWNYNSRVATRTFLYSFGENHIYPLAEQAYRS